MNSDCVYHLYLPMRVLFAESGMKAKIVSAKEQAQRTTGLLVHELESNRAKQSHFDVTNSSTVPRPASSVPFTRRDICRIYIYKQIRKENKQTGKQCGHHVEM